jgi:hypothetical protein
MAFTKSPANDTYSTQRVPAACTLKINNNPYSLVTGVIQEGMTNLIPRKEIDSLTGESMLVAESRAPINAFKVATTTNRPRGCYVWQKTTTDTYYYAVVGTSVYTSTDAQTWTAVTTLATAATTPVGFTEYIDSTNVKKLILVDGVEGFVFTDDTAGVEIVDADFPTPHLPYPVFIDGYLFLAKAGTGDIYNSNLNDPAAWTAGDFISSELYPDDLKAIAKINNYLLAIGSQGCEYFYDAANVTASPLARYEGGSLPFGCPIPTSIAVNKNRLVMLANNNDGELCLVTIEDFEHKMINPTWLTTGLNTSIADGGDPAEVRGYFVRLSGELLYVIKFNAADRSTDPGYAYCFSTGYWIRLVGAVGINGWGIDFTCAGDSNDVVTFVQGTYIDAPTTYSIFGVMGFSNLVGASSTTVSRDDFDNGDTESIYIQINTPQLNFGTMNWKFLHRAHVNVILTPGNLAAANYNITIRFKGVSHTLDWDSDFPFVTRLGYYRDDIMEISYSGTAFAKFKFLELDINKGQH